MSSLPSLLKSPLTTWLAAQLEDPELVQASRGATKSVPSLVRVKSADWWTPSAVVPRL
ncbi:hypothetical protein ABZV52_02030 [Streptomyces sp. NPDC004735]|uniref:hypothetical protein n=1 Tax=Streptomyces TaxID=1883 RepID=UPI0023AFCA04|nr:hypothetical protein [Streptomyces sp. KA12]MDF0372352.1 hypothetical protein [Streptomyces sp. KA12]